MKKMFLSIVVCFLLFLSVLCGCNGPKDKKDKESYEIVVEYDSNTLNSRFGFMHPDDFSDMTDMGVFWQRPHPGPSIWGEIETKSGVFNWDDCDHEVKRSQKYGVNISVCDKQHKGLIEILNNLHSNMKQGKGSEVIETTINKLIRYTKEHFKTEEDLFQKYDYPEKENHQNEHNEFIRKVSDFQSDFKSGQILISVNLLQFLKTWLFNHISVADKKYGPFLQSKGIV